MVGDPQTLLRNSSTVHSPSTGAGMQADNSPRLIASHCSSISASLGTHRDAKPEFKTIAHCRIGHAGLAMPGMDRQCLPKSKEEMQSAR